MNTNVIHCLCVSASVSLIECHKTLLLVSFIDIEIVYIIERHFIIVPPFPVTPTFTSVNLRQGFITMYLSFSVEVAG